MVWRCYLSRQFRFGPNAVTQSTNNNINNSNNANKNDKKKEIEYNNKKELFKKKTKLLKEYEKIKRMTMNFYDVYSEIILMNQKETANPLKYLLRLVGGIAGVLFSLLIFVQLIFIIIRLR